MGNFIRRGLGVAFSLVSFLCPTPLLFRYSYISLFQYFNGFGDSIGKLVLLAYWFCLPLHLLTCSLKTHQVEAPFFEPQPDAQMGRK